MSSRNPKKLHLPQNFAENLLEYEIEYKLSDPPSKETIKSLIELYSTGVEYYESIRSHKYLYFQLKMNEVFNCASAINAINEDNGNNSSSNKSNSKNKSNSNSEYVDVGVNGNTNINNNDNKDDNDPVEQVESPLKKKINLNLKQKQKEVNEEALIHALQIKQKQEKMFKEVAENTSESATVHTVKKMINENDLKTIETNEKVKKEIENQDYKLQEKLKKRKSRLLFSKSFSSASAGVLGMGMGMGEADTQDTLFMEGGNIGVVDLKPIEVSFSNVINENESDDDDNIGKFVRERRMSISQDPSKKSRAEHQATIKTINKD